ncbi:Stp1/IreP family PP2C-type Ser/Thr phosphatase [Oribacterium sp. WCC10]|uniref:Stp1/IreP family PP2C-type Ser/Thr phosphatase n=1 Tax=Oribacterium sp. WCC10 TaxID=1855343 RepID=UPI0008F13200|nr:Stp1/IreP family PP2C-type Ser/Thr phosphatase [Oribacterium sp. WCC10]SFG56631.1 protein phosphatase [Oribacterium sp. WCC10]
MDFFAKTDKGRKRRVNQDYVFATGQQIGALPDLFLLADGMGGHKAGDFASRFAVEEFKKYISEDTSETPAIQLIQNGISSVNERLFILSQEDENLSGMGTTFVTAFIDGNNLTVSNIGDSRAYLIHGNTIKQITRDHSYVEEMIRRGFMRRGSKEYLDSRNIITRAVGIEPHVTADFFEIEITEGDYLLMCSDGLTTMVDNESIRNIICERSSVSDKVQALIDIANINGGKDNIGIVLVDPFGEEVAS